MGAVRKPKPVMLFVGALSGYPDLFAEVRHELVQAYGPIALVSDIWDFDFTDYYTQQMGEGLKRVFYVFEGFVDPSVLADVKLRTNDLEQRFVREHAQLGVERPINLDPGYLMDGKIVLATTKDHHHRVYLRDGIYAEVTLHYSSKTHSYEPWEQWTYTDYRTERYRQFFNQVRMIYLKQVLG